VSILLSLPAFARVGALETALDHLAGRLARQQAHEFDDSRIEASQFGRIGSLGRKPAAPSSKSDGTKRTVYGSECPFFAIERSPPAS